MAREELGSGKVLRGQKRRNTHDYWTSKLNDSRDGVTFGINRQLNKRKYFKVKIRNSALYPQVVFENKGHVCRNVQDTNNGRLGF